MSSIQITTNHPQSSYGVPVCLIDGEVVSDSEGVKACCQALGWSLRDLAKHFGCSYSTARKYSSGHAPVPASGWNVFRDALQPQ